MPYPNLIDLVVLAVTAKEPTTISGISKVAKAITPGSWAPTLDAVAAAVDRSLVAGHLLPVDCESLDTRLQLSNSGRKRVNDLLLEPSESSQQTCASTWATVKICCLDLADEETIRVVLAHLSRTVTEEILCLEQRLTRCPHVGPFTRAWFNLERQRLDAMVRLVSEAGSAVASLKQNQLAHEEVIR